MKILRKVYCSECLKMIMFFPSRSKIVFKSQDMFNGALGMFLQNGEKQSTCQLFKTGEEGKRENAGGGL